MISSYARAALSAVAVVAAVSACASTGTESADGPTSNAETSRADSSTSSAPPTSAEAPASPTPTDEAPVSTGPNESEAGQDPQDPSGAVTDPCASASEATLGQALVGSEIEQRLANPVDLVEYQCAGGYARAKTSSQGGTVQPAGVLFRYDEAGGWMAVDVGSSIDCTGQHGVPPEVAAQLSGCS